MELWAAFIYGIIQGVTEFLPVSSSGHLALIPRLMDIQDPGVAFDLWMHVGTALAVVVYFRKEIKGLLQETLAFCKSPKEKPSSRRIYLFNFILTTGATGVAGVLILLLQKYLENAQRAPLIIGVNLIIFGILMGASDYHASKKLRLTNKERSMDSIRPIDAILIGLFQALAIFPGVSRSGITLTITRYLGLSRENATSYSFLLSLPLIIAGAILKVGDISAQVNVTLLIIGVLTSFFVGLLAIHLFFGIIKKIGLGVFCFYRIILAIFVFSYLL